MTEHSDLAAKLRDSGYRLTPQRELILKAVERLGHATPDEVLEAVHEDSTAINASTVYRTLEVLEGLGLVRHAHLSDRAPTYHSTSDHEHFHLVCRNCGRVSSVDPGMAGEMLERLRTEEHFLADVGHLTVFGRCLQCPTPVVEEVAAGGRLETTETSEQSVVEEPRSVVEEPPQAASRNHPEERA